MTNIAKVMALLADGHPRTLKQIAQATKVRQESVLIALADIRRVGEGAAQRQEMLFTLTPKGQARVEREKADAEELVDRAAEQAASVASRARARKAVSAALRGEVPNSVFAWGQGRVA
jgi:hypothetical protein